MCTSPRTCSMAGATNVHCISGALARKAVSAQYPLECCGDAAELAAFLISKRSPWISGQIIAVDGGFLGTRPQVKVS